MFTRVNSKLVTERDDRSRSCNSIDSQNCRTITKMHVWTEGLATEHEVNAFDVKIGARCFANIGARCFANIGARCFANIGARCFEEITLLLLTQLMAWQKVQAEFEVKFQTRLNKPCSTY